jgi:hypothetical protein
MLTYIATAFWILFDVWVSVVTANALPVWEWYAIVASGGLLAIATVVGGIIDRRAYSKDIKQVTTGQEQHTTQLQALSVLMTPDLARKLAFELDVLTNADQVFTPWAHQMLLGVFEAMLPIVEKIPNDQELAVDLEVPSLLIKDGKIEIVGELRIGEARARPMVMEVARKQSKMKLVFQKTGMRVE